MLRHPGIICLGEDLLGPGDGPGHALGGRRQDNLRAEPKQQHPAFQAHALRHRQDQAIAAGRGHPGQRDPGVAGCRLHDRRPARSDQPAFLGVGNHRDADPVLDTEAGTERLDFA